MSKIVNADAFEYCKKLPEASIDLILTDPPYGITRNKWDKELDITLFWNTFLPLCKPTTPIILFSHQPFTSKLIMSNPTMFKYTYTWNKVNRVTNFLNAKKQPLRVTEDIVIFYNKQPTYNIQFSTGKPYNTISGATTRNYSTHQRIKINNTGTRYPINLLNYKADTGITSHPTQKPLSLLKFLIRTYTNKYNLILDPFAGTGSIAIAATNLKRNILAVEINKDYYNVILHDLK